MSAFRLTNADLLTVGPRIIHNTLHKPIVKETVKRYGYGEAEFAECTARCDALEEALYAQRDCQGHMMSAAEAVREAREALHRDRYMAHVAIARVAFEQEITRRRLGLKGRRPRALDAWLQTVRRFYDTLLEDEDLQRGMARYGILADDLRAGREDARHLDQLDRQRKTWQAKAKQATETVHQRRRALAKWLANYQKIARVALADYPALVPRFGEASAG